MNRAFIVGNGTSRNDFDLTQLIDNGKIYGCNALYREFKPDYLIAVDVKMVLEINQSGYQNRNLVYTNPNKAYSKFKNFNFFDPSKGWSSGPTALWFASQHQYDEIFILGFDYKGLDNGEKVNNIYADTRNYKKSRDRATYFGNWLRQTKSVIAENKKISYYRVIQPDNFCPPELNTFENFKNISYNDFKNMM